MAEPKKNRFYLARTKHNQHGFQSAKDVSEITGISRSLIDDLESETSSRNVSYKTVKKLAEYYGVSSDYLMGFYEYPWITPELSAVTQYTGLSEQSVANINMIHRLKPDLISALSFLLDNISFYRSVLTVVAHFRKRQHLVSGEYTFDDDFMEGFSEAEWDVVERLETEFGVSLFGPVTAENQYATEAGEELTGILKKYINPHESASKYERKTNEEWLVLLRSMDDNTDDTIEDLQTLYDGTKQSRKEE